MMTKERLDEIERIVRQGGGFIGIGVLFDELLSAAGDAIRMREEAAFRLEAQSREAEEARFYRYLRNEAGTGDDEDGPMICSGLGDNFDYLRGEECDIEIRAALEPQ